MICTKCSQNRNSWFFNFTTETSCLYCYKKLKKKQIEERELEIIKINTLINMIEKNQRIIVSAPNPIVTPKPKPKPPPPSKPPPLSKPPPPPPKN